jgi:hypothetical protein
MKKLYFIPLIIGVLIFTSLSAQAFNWKFWQKKDVNIVICPVSEAKTDFEIIPTMDTKSNAKNVVWVGTFQLIWNDLINELIKHPVEFAGYKSVMAENLNKQSFTTEDLSESAYYKKWGLASPKIRKEIEIGIKEKFNETSDILGAFDWTPAEGKYILYAMLKKDFEYAYKFDTLTEAPFDGSKGNVKYFGIDGNSDRHLRNNISVLFYNNENDYAVSIKTKSEDIIYLYRTNDDKTLDSLYNDMLIKNKQFNGKSYMTKEDRFKAPVIEFKKEREFKELCNKPIKNSDFMISKALETVQFKMDETGVKLKSEAGMMVSLTALPVRELPRYFYFDKRYIIFLQDKKTKPYFAMKVEDAKKLQN